jgi:hypothetical protein
MNGFRPLDVALQDQQRNICRRMPLDARHRHQVVKATGFQKDL